MSLKNMKIIGSLLSRSTVKLYDSIRKLRVKINSVLNEFCHLNTWDKVQMLNSQCLSLYGCELWELGNPDIVQMCCLWGYCSRQMPNFNAITRCTLIPRLMSTPKLEPVVHLRLLSFCIKGINHTSSDSNNLFTNA